MAAISIATAKEKRAEQYLINDINKPIVRLLKAAIDSPSELVGKYTKVWEEQFTYPDGHLDHYYYIRDCFNEGTQSAENMLYLLARCVKGAVRYGKNGNFNQSPDKRRHGTNPKNISDSVNAISALLKGKTVFSTIDYREIFEIAEPGDLVYMDPPYQGVSNTRDNRYYAGVGLNDFSESIKILNRKGVDYIISYDGACGGREYGSDLPGCLNCTKILLNAGLSTQATLLGKRDTTYEALYVSENLAGVTRKIPEQMTFACCERCQRIWYTYRNISHRRV
jgi:DNA adenine methylase